MPTTDSRTDATSAGIESSSSSTTTKDETSSTAITTAMTLPTMAATSATTESLISLTTKITQTTAVRNPIDTTIATEEPTAKITTYPPTTEEMTTISEDFTTESPFPKEISGTVCGRRDSEHRCDSAYWVLENDHTGRSFLRLNSFQEGASVIRIIEIKKDVYRIAINDSGILKFANPFRSVEHPESPQKIAMSELPDKPDDNFEWKIEKDEINGNQFFKISDLQSFSYFKRDFWDIILSYIGRSASEQPGPFLISFLIFLNLVVGRSKLVTTAFTRTAAQVSELTFGMVRKCAAKLLLLSLVGHVAAGALDIEQIQNQNDDEPKFVEVTIRELEETEFVGKMDASVILFPEPMMSNERVRRSGNGQRRRLTAKQRRKLQQQKKNKNQYSSYAQITSSKAPKKGLTQPGWSMWAAWGKCSVTCGEGFRLRRRFCKNSSVGSRDCPGSAVERQRCNPANCGGYEWGLFEYTSCSKECGGGTTIAKRQCFKQGTRYVVDESNCGSGPTTARVKCNTHPCSSPEAYAWTSFEFNECDKDCGGGISYGFRSCINKVNGNYVDDSKCKGDAYTQKPCNTHPCFTARPKSTKSPATNEWQCGTQPSQFPDRPKVNLRIHGGAISNDGEWPWQVSLQHRNCNHRNNCEWKHLCGGSIVDNKWIVTAAHCIEESGYFTDNNNPGDDWAIVVGMDKLNYKHDDVANKNSDGTRFLLEKIIPYSEYRFQYITHHDIALLKLRTEITYGFDRLPICLGGGRKPKHGDKCSISGWGYTTGNPKDTKLSYHLKDAEIPVVSFNQCRKTGIWYKLLQEDSHMCAGDSSKVGLDSCGGDSGGPLSCLDQNSGQYYLAGVTSFGFSDCGKVGHLGIYANMANYEGWVKNTIAADKMTYGASTTVEPYNTAAYSYYYGDYDYKSGLPGSAINLDPGPDHFFNLSYQGATLPSACDPSSNLPSHLTSSVAPHRETEPDRSRQSHNTPTKFNTNSKKRNHPTSNLQTTLPLL
ncbi:Oidioi.mRNA.OKI2018_I69.chr1.g3432.t3.cds [Oikopleura dioica]|uniref:Oidioi.mRNA.OKI2018_I69.chr1.g3432.t3.cds n=1 Tax=Oikopleura dioica TaxID=34765 RepID=A0ABN7SUQ2_OIKDI|nr:Oidioi.mRNA.OKI2018_I69.chr1.g3432.t3.cds [Oikopleura dioica]